MKTLLETIDEKFRPWGYATELINGNVVGAYGNGNFTEFGKDAVKTALGVIYPQFGYKKTASGVEKIKFPRHDEKLIQLNMMGGKLVHNRSFCFTDYGILSFISGQLVDLPFTAAGYETEVGEEETIFIANEKRYYFDGIMFIEK